MFSVYLKKKYGINVQKIFYQKNKIFLEKNLQIFLTIMHYMYDTHCSTVNLKKNALLYIPGLRYKSFNTHSFSGLTFCSGVNTFNHSYLIYRTFDIHIFQRFNFPFLFQQTKPWPRLQYYFITSVKYFQHFVKNW